MKNVILLVALAVISFSAKAQSNVKKRDLSIKEIRVSKPLVTKKINTKVEKDKTSTPVSSKKVEVAESKANNKARKKKVYNTTGTPSF